VGVVVVAHDRTPPGYAANVCVGLRFLKLPATAGIGERMRPAQLGAGDRIVPGDANAEIMNLLDEQKSWPVYGGGSTPARLNCRRQ
jgi:hypothetical protein